MVVSTMFYFHPYLRKIPILTKIFQMGWFNHQQKMMTGSSFGNATNIDVESLRSTHLLSGSQRRRGRGFGLGRGGLSLTLPMASKATSLRFGTWNHPKKTPKTPNLRRYDWMSRVFEIIPGPSLPKILLMVQKSG